MIRTTSDPRALAGAVRALVRRLDPLQAITPVWPLTQEIDQSIAPVRMIGLLLLGLSAVAILLAAAGIYAVLAQWVAARRVELGLRLALGADAASLRQMVLRETIMMALAGVGVGAPSRRAGDCGGRDGGAGAAVGGSGDGRRGGGVRVRRRRGVVRHPRGAGRRNGSGPAAAQRVIASRNCPALGEPSRSSAFCPEVSEGYVSDRVGFRRVRPDRLGAVHVTGVREPALEERRFRRPEHQLHPQPRDHVELTDGEADPHRDAGAAGPRRDERVEPDHGE